MPCLKGVFFGIENTYLIRKVKALLRIYEFDSHPSASVFLFNCTKLLEQRAPMKENV
jgi:hypothetical protein